MDVYPIDESGPLCALFDDPAYWAKLFVDPEDRQAAKRALKRLPNRGGFGSVIKVEKDDVIGRAIHALVKSPKGRLALHYELTKRLDEYESDPDDMVAQVMFQTLSTEKKWFKPLEKRLVEDDNELRFLTKDGLDKYLESEGCPDDPDQQRWLATTVAAFALVAQDEDEPAALIATLTELGPPYSDFFKPAASA